MHLESLFADYLSVTEIYWKNNIARPFALYALPEQMDLVPIHAAPPEHKGNIKTQCCQILNDEWPRSETLRLRSLDSSRDDLPMCLALVQWFQKDMSISKWFKLTYMKRHSLKCNES